MHVRRASIGVVAFSVMAGCATGGAPAGEARVDPGPPNARWAQVSTRALAAVHDDPGALACDEPDRWSFQRGAEVSGWADRCGWRRHVDCVERCPLLMAGCSRSCEEDTPPELDRANAVLHVRRLFASTEPCEERDTVVELLHADEPEPWAERHRAAMDWRAVGCGKRARVRCRPGSHASGWSCERVDFAREAELEVVDEVSATLAAAGCGGAKVVSGAKAVTLADGRPGLSLAMRACDREVIFACVRPDLVPASEAACREAPVGPDFVAAARERARARVASEMRCELAADALSPARQAIGDRVRVTFRVTTCNASHDVRAVSCWSRSLVDTSVEGCAFESVESDWRSSRDVAAALAAERDSACANGNHSVALISASGEDHVVLVSCFGMRREPTFYRCAKDYARDTSTCVVDARLQDAAAALERAAGERFQREEQCPADKTVTSPVEGRVGAWRVRGEGCGVTRDYHCADLADPIDRCTR